MVWENLIPLADDMFISFYCSLLKIECTVCWELGANCMENQVYIAVCSAWPCGSQRMVDLCCCRKQPLISRKSLTVGYTDQAKRLKCIIKGLSVSFRSLWCWSLHGLCHGCGWVAVSQQGSATLGFNFSNIFFQRKKKLTIHYCSLFKLISFPCNSQDCWLARHSVTRTAGLVNLLINAI